MSLSLRFHSLFQNLTSCCSGGHCPRSQRNEAGKPPFSLKLYTAVLACRHLSNNIIMLPSCFSLWYLKNVQYTVWMCWWLLCFLSRANSTTAQPNECSLGCSSAECHPRSHGELCTQQNTLGRWKKHLRIRPWLLTGIVLTCWFFPARCCIYGDLFQCIGSFPFYPRNLFHIMSLD